MGILKRGLTRSFENIEIARAKRSSFDKCMNHIFMQKAKNVQANEAYLKKKYGLKDLLFYRHIQRQTGYDFNKYKKLYTMYKLNMTYPDKICFNAAILAVSFNIDICDILDKNLELLDKRNLIRKQF